MIPLEETISTLKNMDIQRYTVVAQFISEISDKKTLAVISDDKLKNLAEASMNKYSEAYEKLSQ